MSNMVQEDLSVGSKGASEFASPNMLGQSCCLGQQSFDFNWDFKASLSEFDFGR